MLIGLSCPLLIGKLELNSPVLVYTSDLTNAGASRVLEHGQWL